ncbi:MAG: hypothetical protein RR619_09560 [Raoultibacter sp.]
MLDRLHIARIKSIKDRVASEFDAGDWELLATYLGDSGMIINAHSRLLRSLHWGDEDYPACVADVIGQIAHREPEALDLIEGMLKDKTPNAQVENRMGVETHFLIDASGSNVDTTMATAMMPFGPTFDDVRDSMRGACKTVGLELKTADDIWDNAILIQDIFNLISNSRIVIVDFTGKNPNVMYETGVAHALQKEVIPISQSLDDVPFDLKHHRIQIYDNNAAGRLDLQHALESRMKTIMDKHGWEPLPF